MARSRCEFSSLPTELKARILELVAWQEEAWVLRMKALEAAKEDTEEDYDTEFEREPHVDSLLAASSVSREWRALTVNHIFHTITPQRAELSTFKYLILAQHSHRFTRVIFAKDDEEHPDACIYLFSILLLLPNLHSMSLYDEVAYALFGNDLKFEPDGPGTANEDEQARAAGLRLLAPRITDLTLDRFTVLELRCTLLLWTRLRQLHLLQVLGTMATVDSKFAWLPGYLLGMSQLQYLHIELQNDSPSSKWSPEAFAPLRSNPPPLTTLRFQSTHHHPLDLDFISIFSSTLKHVHLSAGAPSEASAVPTPLDLPHLASLHLDMDDIPVLSHVLPAFTSAPLSSLVLILPVGMVDVIRGQTVVPAHLADTFPNLRRLSLYTKSPSSICAYQHPLIAKYCVERGLAPPAPAVFDKVFLTSIRDADNGVICAGLREVLAFGSLEVARLEAGGKVADSIALVEALRPLDAHRSRWLD